ncbi:MAG: acyl-CoA carboxylase subunit epsilon [Bowdeniella nasicola]|nr:acyl-CoA carboxylase subunit epsilon [Bowdeniella nasicola]
MSAAPLFQVIAGHPNDGELAALVAGLTQVAVEGAAPASTGGGATSNARESEWRRRARPAGPALRARHATDAWRWRDR